tara:strand:- start:15718 stop:15861 length:144 start_codon:yes stop_codon:yes gene_type:complete
MNSALRCNVWILKVEAKPELLKFRTIVFLSDAIQQLRSFYVQANIDP